MVNLVVKGTEGLGELAILERLHHNPVSTVYRNICAPLLDTIVIEDMTFCVFPMLFPSSSRIACQDMREVLIMIEQCMEVSPTHPAPSSRYDTSSIIW